MESKRELALLLRCGLVLVLILSRISGREFNPYADNGGTIVGVAGKGYVILASDTRLSDGYVIRSRSINRLVELDPERLLFAASGCWSDACGLVKVLEAEMDAHKWDSANRRPFSVHALAHLLSMTLYNRRVFPYYSLCVVAGIDDETRDGALYRYDSIGSFERVQATCAGKGEQLIQPMLDEATKMEESLATWTIAPSGDAFLSSPVRHNLGVEAACDLVVRAFRSASEREITVGDGVELLILSEKRLPDGPLEDPDSSGGKRNLKKSHSTRRFCFLPKH